MRVSCALRHILHGVRFAPENADEIRRCFAPNSSLYCVGYVAQDTQRLPRCGHLVYSVVKTMLLSQAYRIYVG